MRRLRQPGLFLKLQRFLTVPHEVLDQRPDGWIVGKLSEQHGARVNLY